MRTRLPRRYYQTAGDPAGGGGGGGASTIDWNDEAVQAELNKRIEESEAGLRKNRDDLRSEKAKLQEQLDSLTSQMEELKTKWAGKDPDEVGRLLQAIGESEEAKLIADGKWEEVVERRSASLRKDMEGRVNAAQEALDATKAEVAQRDATIKRLIVDGEVTRAAAVAKVHPTAIPDIVQRALGVFSIEDEAPVMRDQEGVLVLGKDGKSPLSPSEWLEGCRADAPHWFEGSSGGGTGSGRNGGADRSVEDTSNMTGTQMIAAGLSNVVGGNR